MHGRGLVVLERLENPLAVGLWRRAQTYAAKLGASYYHHRMDWVVDVSFKKVQFKRCAKMRNYMQPQETDHNNQNVQRNDGLAVTRNCKMGACKQKVVSYRVTTTTQVRVNYEKDL